MLRNHGLLTVGRSVAEAFTAMYLFETACTIQVRAQVDGTLYEYRSVPSEPMSGWLAANAPAGARIGYDPWAATRLEPVRFKWDHLKRINRLYFKHLELHEIDLKILNFLNFLLNILHDEKNR